MLDEIKAHAKAVMVDENAVLDKLKKQASAESAARRETIQQEIGRLRRRVQELEHMTAKLYEDKVSGTITGTTFSLLIEKSEQERIQKSEQLNALLDEADKARQDMEDIQKWASIIKKYLDLQELDRETIDELIDHIEIGERTVIDGQKQQDIKIFYRFVGEV